MALTVKELRSLPLTGRFRLAAGAAGQKRLVEHVNLLDFEYDKKQPDGKQPDGLFQENAIVITSFMYAKDEPQKLYDAVRQLIVDGVSALAVKTIYYQELPQDLLAYADEKAFPVFMFHDEEGYYEDIIVELRMAIEEQNDIAVLEEKIAFLLQESGRTAGRYGMAGEVFAELKTPFQCFYFCEKEYRSEYLFHHKIVRLRRQLKDKYLVFPYQHGILLIVHGETESDYKQLLVELGFAGNQYFTGISNVHTERQESIYALQESLYAREYSEMSKQDVSCFTEMGIWQMVIPQKNNYWFRSYCDEVIDKLRDSEAESRQEIYYTAKAYVECSGEVNAAAAALDVHPNTVRYRLGKARERLGMEGNEPGFYEVIFLVFQYQKVSRS